MKSPSPKRKGLPKRKSPKRKASPKRKTINLSDEQMSGFIPLGKKK